MSTIETVELSEEQITPRVQELLESRLIRPHLEEYYRGLESGWESFYRLHIDYCAYGDYVGSTVERSNFEVITKMEGVDYSYGDFGYHYAFIA